MVTSIELQRFVHSTQLYQKSSPKFEINRIIITCIKATNSCKNQHVENGLLFFSQFLLFTFYLTVSGIIKRVLNRKDNSNMPNLTKKKVYPSHVDVHTDKRTFLIIEKLRFKKESFDYLINRVYLVNCSGTLVDLT